MTEHTINNMSEKKKATVRKALLITSVNLIGISLYSFFNPELLGEILNTDHETTSLISVVIGLVGITDFAIGFILFKSKERV